MAKSAKMPELEFSPLSGPFVKDDITIIIEIFKPQDTDGSWELEIITGEDAGIAWDDTFATDQEAYDELMLLIEEKGILDLITPPDDEDAPNAAGVQ